MRVTMLTSAAAVAFCLLPAPLRAQGTFPPATLANLQVLAKDTTVPQAIAVMRTMTQALGVRCQFCHVGVEGQPLDQFDFVSDTVDKKTAARAMMRLTREINAQLAAAMPAAPAVTCYTCHRGERQPVHAPPPKPGA
jgi:hypothetical protein